MLSPCAVTFCQDFPCTRPTRVPGQFMAFSFSFFFLILAQVFFFLFDEIRIFISVLSRPN